MDAFRRRRNGKIMKSSRVNELFEWDFILSPPTAFFSWDSYSRKTALVFRTSFFLRRVFLFAFSLTLLKSTPGLTRMENSWQDNPVLDFVHLSETRNNFFCSSRCFDFSSRASTRKPIFIIAVRKRDNVIFSEMAFSSASLSSLCPN